MENVDAAHGNDDAQQFDGVRIRHALLFEAFNPA
jgi:hypothetical protein